MSPAEPLVRLEGARLGYAGRTILEDVDLRVEPGDFLAVVGPNGAGKTTLLRAILGITRPLAGHVSRRGRLGYAPQRGAPDAVFPVTAAEVVAHGLLGRGAFSWGERLRAPLAALLPARGVDPALAPLPAATREPVERALRACGMWERRRAFFRDLSGGQKQRLLVARALVSDPDVLVLDEPTNDLDLRGEQEVLELIRALHAGGRTVIMVSHLLQVVARVARRLAFVREGRVVAGEAAEMLTAPRLEELYGVPVTIGEVGGQTVVLPAAGGAA